jgi:hypothetical protein
VAYDCFGAGQLVTRVTFGGADWRTGPHPAEAVFDAFETVRRLQELRWYVRQAEAVAGEGPLAEELAAAGAELASLTRSDADRLAGLDVDALRERVAPLLRRTAELARAAVLRVSGTSAAPGGSGAPAAPRGKGRGAAAGQGKGAGPRGRGRGRDRSDRRGADLAGRDLLGADLRGVDLRGASLRGALLIAADLRGARLDAADLIGADLRDADLRGTDLSRALFLTSAQVAAARGDGATTLPPELPAPARWS